MFVFVLDLNTIFPTSIRRERGILSPQCSVELCSTLHDGHDCRQLYSSSVTAKIQQDQTMYYMPKCKKKKRKRKTRKEVFLGLNCL